LSQDARFHLTIAASNLKVAAPEQFEALLRAFQMLDEQAGTALRSAPPDGIFNAQGRAALASDLRKWLETCMEQRRTYENRG
jgi:hypothetical protein